jgi:hypothetical protein
MIARAVVTVIALLLLTTAGWRDSSAEQASNRDIQSAMSEMSQEYLECAAYYSWSATCLKDDPRPEASPLAANMQKVGVVLLARAVQTGKTVGITDEAFAARLKLTTANIASLTHSNCANASVLLVRYAAFCKGLTENGDQRLEEILKACSRPL